MLAVAVVALVVADVVVAVAVVALGVVALVVVVAVPALVPVPAPIPAVAGIAAVGAAPVPFGGLSSSVFSPWFVVVAAVVAGAVQAGAEDAGVALAAGLAVSAAYKPEPAGIAVHKKERQMSELLIQEHMDFRFQRKRGS